MSYDVHNNIISVATEIIRDSKFLIQVTIFLLFHTIQNFKRQPSWVLVSTKLNGEFKKGGALNKLSELDYSPHLDYKTKGWHLFIPWRHVRLVPRALYSISSIKYRRVGSPHCPCGPHSLAKLIGSCKSL